LPRHPDPELEARILEAASRLWARGGEKSLTMRAVAKAAGTTTPTVYERYRDRAEILKALRLQTREDLYSALTRARTLADSIHNYLKFALEHSHAYEVLFDGVGRPPSLHEPWPSFNLMRERLAKQMGSGPPHLHNRLMLAIWSQMHGTAMLIIRGRFEGALRTQAVHACMDTVETLIRCAKRPKQMPHSGPHWPSTLILGKGEHSRVGDVDEEEKQPPAKTRTKKSRA